MAYGNKQNDACAAPVRDNRNPQSKSKDWQSRTDVNDISLFTIEEVEAQAGEKD